MRLSDLAVHAGTELAEVVRDCEVETAELCADIPSSGAAFVRRTEIRLLQPV